MTLSSPHLCPLAAKKLPQAAAIKQQTHALVPEAAAAAAGGEVQRFAFDKPSPDDVVQAAQQQQGPAGAAKAYKPIQAQQQAQQSQQQQAGEQRVQQGAADAAAASMQGLSVSEASVQPAQQSQQPQRRRPLSEYRPDADLAAACAAAAAAEEAGGGKPRLHLVVLGHVDAGKSTLMGRMLYELGLISDKAVHKTQVGAGRGRGGSLWVPHGWLGGQGVSPNYCGGCCRTA